jgi:hypothetical protein
MFTTNMKSILSLAGLCLLILAALFAYDNAQSKKAVTMTNVGGTSSECTCTHRLEQ